jgi:Na+-driven multidrug efflux pump
MLTQTAINLSDTIMVGQLEPTYSVAGQSAIGYSMILLWAFGGFLSAIQVGTQAIVARRKGEGELGRAGQALDNSLAIAVVCGAVVSLGAWAAMPWIFERLDSNPTVVELGVGYSRWRMLGVLSMVATMSYKSFFDGIGQTHVHMFAAIAMNVANIVLNWVFIYGVGPFPQMFVEGAGFASFISTYLGLTITILWSLQRKYRRAYGYYALAQLDRKVMWDIARVSVPSGLATVFVMLGFGVFLVMVGHVDAKAAEESLRGLNVYSQAASWEVVRATADNLMVADPLYNLSSNRLPVNTSATKIIMDIMSLSFMSMIALGMGTATLVGQSLGAKRPDLAERYGWESAKLGAAMMVVFAISAYCFPAWYISLFNPDPDVIAAGVPVLKLMAGSSILVAVGLVLAQALYGAGMTRYVMAVEAILHVVCLMPLTYLLGVVLDLGLVGIWSAAFAYIALLAAAMVYKFREGKWKEVVL